jgi:hypothetical protein
MEQAMGEQVTIPRRFNGPPDSGNGGYSCGVVARLLGGPAEVTLRCPPPLGRPLEVVRRGDGGVELRDGERLVAEGVPAELEIEVPPPVSLAEAEDAARRFPWFTGHPFPRCFVCGPDRRAGDGLRILAGPVAGRPVAAAPWTPSPADCGPDGTVLPEIAWAALDCPSWFGAHAFHPSSGVALLGRLRARLLAPIRAGEPCLAMGWHLGTEGRKVIAGSALYSAGGELRAAARATWIILPPER